MLDLHLQMYYIFFLQTFGPFCFSLLYIYGVVEKFNFVLLTLTLLVVYSLSLRGIEE